MEQQTGSKSLKEYVKAVYCHPAYLTYMQSTSWEKAMAPHSSTLAWKIPWMEEPGRLQSMGSLESDTTERLHFHFSLSCIGEGTGNPLQCSFLENSRDRGAWWAAVCGVAQSRTRLKQLSSSSRSSSSIRSSSSSRQTLGFTGSSAGKESARNARDPGSIPRSGSSPEEAEKLSRLQSTGSQRVGHD